jgi:hypothetical protein
MKRMAWMIPVCLLASCSASTLSGVDPAALPAAPESLSMPCEGPAPLSGALTASDVTRLWALDRGRLLACGERLAALATFYLKRDGALIGKQKGRP